jgi:N-glycosylase/DNA lyase
MDDWFSGGNSQGSVDVAALLDSVGGSGLVEMVAMGALISYALTSDGGALSITVTVDGAWRREYFRDEETLTLWVSEALPYIKDATERRIASSADAKRQRRPRGR